jgi:radical SAM protein (TIGR01212 family)
MSEVSSAHPRYHAFGHYLRRRFGCRVHKITLHAGMSCPNRDGSRGTGGCTFCNNTGFSPAVRLEPGAIRDQMLAGMQAARVRGRATRFIAYFQAYSNTHAPVDLLARLYEEAWCSPDVVGMSVGTRPDCIDADRVALLEGFARRGEVWIEYGLQSSHDATLRAVNRCHTYEEFVRAVELTAGRGIRICVHTILGLPGETPAMMLETHRRLAELPIDGIKIHLLHVMRDTVMERQFRRGEIEMLGRRQYVELVCDVLELLPPAMVIQRMHADAPADVLVAPDWCLDKSGVLAEIRETLVRRDSWQGKARGARLDELLPVPRADLSAP